MTPQLKTRMKCLDVERGKELNRVGDLQDEADMLSYVRGQATVQSRKGNRLCLREKKTQDMRMRDEIIKKYLKPVVAQLHEAGQVASVEEPVIGRVVALIEPSHISVSASSTTRGGGGQGFT